MIALVLALMLHHPTGPCTGRVYATPPRLGPAVTRQHVRNLIGCATDHWRVPGGEAMALCIADRESGFNPRAYNSWSGASGVYQHLARYWPGRASWFLRRRWFPNSRWPVSAFRARANVIVAVRMAHSGGWAPWGGYCG